MRKRFVPFLLMLLATLGASAQTSAQWLQALERVNDTWQSQHSPYEWAFWDKAAYYTGNMEAYRLTGKAQWYQYSDKWCRHNQWKGARSTDKANWKYKTYGEGQDFVLFADWQICFQTYIDMYNLVPDEYKVARAKEVMSHMCSMQENKFWWWSDALYMAMPIMTKMYKLTGEEMYLDKLYECYTWSDSLMWDADAQLYYRDGKYIWPKVTTACDGGKSFWARGDGWVLAGLAKVLSDMPADYKHRDFFVQRFQQLAEGVARCQQEGGYWSRSMLCEADAPGPETSGTGFFCYGLLWGVNNGLLSNDQYKDVIERGCSYLYNTAMQSDGTIGYVQPIGEKPDPTKIVDAKSQAPFGTGAWLLAACERVRYLDRQNSGEESFGVSVENPTSMNRNDVIELDAQTVFQKLKIAGGRQFEVKDADGVRLPYQLTSDGKLLIQVFVRPNDQANLTISATHHVVPQFRLDANGRIYPNREDDLSFENDRTAWRLYGPKMHNKGVTGFDAFCKNVQYPILDHLYQSELTSYGVNEQLKKQGRGGEWAQIHRNVYTYHRDRGQGMDAYSVGKTLGAGAPALLVNGEMQLGDVYEKAEILDNGPLRFTTRMEMYEQNGVKETRTITLDRGQHLARVDVSYEGAPEKASACAGIIVHDSNTSYVIDKKNGYVAYADAMDTPQGQNGLLYIACLFPGKDAKLSYDASTKHVLGQKALPADGKFSYYCGTAWSKYDVPTMDVWQALLSARQQQLQQPLKITIL